MNIKLLLRTVRHLRTMQVVHQVLNRAHKHRYTVYDAPKHKMPAMVTSPIDKHISFEGKSFSFINLKNPFLGWNYVGNGTLWTYNLNYFDFLNQPGITANEGCKWIDRFIADIPTITWGLDPYPIALRGINWIKFFCKFPECAIREREDSLWSQYKLIEKKLEYHLMGNHLLEDAFSWYIGAVYYGDEAMKAKAYKLLTEQLKEQTLQDGAHYEQSVMYHCILLDRLLDCINFSPTDELKSYAEVQLGWLKSICYKDGSIPMMNDAALGIAPTMEEIEDYAKRLGVTCEPTALGASGYRKMANDTWEATIDIGNITASYQPGHTHADTFNYELRLEGKPFIVDTGISTYDKTSRRQYERSTKAHNCVVVDGKDSSEVWGGFRVGKRCQVKVIKDEACQIEASHNGFEKTCTRKFAITDESFSIDDYYDGEAISYIHLIKDADTTRIHIEGAKNIEIQEEKASVEYNRFYDIKVMKIWFIGHLKYSIQ